MSQGYCSSLLQNATLHFFCVSKISTISGTQLFLLNRNHLHFTFLHEHILAGSFFSCLFLSHLPTSTCTCSLSAKLKQFLPFALSLNCHFCHDESLHLFSLPQTRKLFVISKFSPLHFLLQENNISFPEIFFPLSILSNFLVGNYNLFQNSTFPQSLPQGKLYLSYSL